MSTLLQVGDDAPQFSAIAVGGRFGEGQTVTLSDLRGRVVALYFYPKDATPGCTMQACGLRDAWPATGAEAEIFGVSADSAASHSKFIAKHRLPFPLLVDEEKQMIQAYGVWVEKRLFGFKWMGTERATFVIDAEGKIKAVRRKVKPLAHAAWLIGLLRPSR